MKYVLDKLDNVVVVYLVVLLIDAWMTVYLGAALYALLVGVGIGICCSMLYAHTVLDRLLSNLQDIKRTQDRVEHRIAYLNREINNDQRTIH